MRARFKRNGLAALVLALGLASPAASVTIDFDDLDASGGPVEVGGHYASLGVVFDDLYVLDTSANSWYTTGPPAAFYSAPNVGIIDDGAPFGLTVTATFVDPTSGAASVTDFVGAAFFDSEVGTALLHMTAYGLAGEVLGTYELTTPAEGVAVGGLSIPGIHRVVLTTDPDGAAFDLFTFNDLVTPEGPPAGPSVPEPGAVVTFAAGLLMVAGHLRGIYGQRTPRKGRRRTR